MRVFSGIDELRAAAGTRVGASDWVTIDQARIDGFADATDDHQWIHTDAERAANGPFGSTIAHGFLTLALLPALMKDVYRVESVQMGVNYGLNRVRFTAPVPVGGRVRALVDLESVTEAAGGSYQVVNLVTVELAGSPKPAVVAEWLTRQYP